MKVSCFKASYLLSWLIKVVSNYKTSIFIAFCCIIFLLKNSRTSFDFGNLILCQNFCSCVLFPICWTQLAFVTHWLAFRCAVCWRKTAERVDFPYPPMPCLISAIVHNFYCACCELVSVSPDACSRSLINVAIFCNLKFVINRRWFCTGVDP